MHIGIDISLLKRGGGVANYVGYLLSGLKKAHKDEHYTLFYNSFQNSSHLVIEAVSRRIFPAEGYRKEERQEEVWLIIERRLGDKQTELRYFFSKMPQVGVELLA